MPFSAFVLNNYHDKMLFIVFGVNIKAILDTNFTPGEVGHILSSWYVKPLKTRHVNRWEMGVKSSRNWKV